MHIMRYIRKVHCYLRAKLSIWLLESSTDIHLSSQLIYRLKNCHNGKRAFIICNGPSLKADDLELLHNQKEITFSCNKIDKIFNQTNWRPTYYAVLDETYQHSLLQTMQEVPAEIKFFRRESYLTTRKVKGNKVFLKTFGDKSLLQDCKFSEDATKGIYTIATTTYSLIQLAVHMGIRDIYIIGCDNSYSIEIMPDGTSVDTGRNSYFEGSKQSDQKIAASTWQMNIAYDYARQYADANDIQIYNATRGGHLEAFERVDFDKLFQS